MPTTGPAAASSSSTVPTRLTRSTPRSSTPPQEEDDYSFATATSTRGYHFLSRPPDVEASYTEEQRHASFKLAADRLTFKGSQKPYCGRGLKSKQYTSGRADSLGKPFLRCHVGKDSPNDCGYFYWVRSLMLQDQAVRLPRFGKGPGEPYQTYATDLLHGHDQLCR